MPWKLLHLTAVILVGAMGASADAKDKVKVGFIGPLTGGVSVNGLGGRNSADLAVKLRNADAKAKYEYELVVLDDECKPNVAVQVATKMAADNEIIAAATHYCSSTAIATVDTYHKFGLPVIVWGAVLPDITYRNKYRRDPSRQRHHDQPERRQCRADHQARLQELSRSIHDTTDYGKGHNEYFSKALAKLGGKIVGTFGVTADQQDFTAELTQIKALNPEVIYFGGLTPIGVRIRSQMDKLGIKARVRRHLGHRVGRLHPGARPAGRGRAGVPRRRADREAARRQVLHGELRRARNTTIRRRPTAPSRLPRWT